MLPASARCARGPGSRRLASVPACSEAGSRASHVTLFSAQQLLWRQPALSPLYTVTQSPAVGGRGGPVNPVC